MLSLSRIEHLADEGSLHRGRDYYRRGRVRQLTINPDGTVRAIVEGEQLYRVVLRDRTWDCSCPVGADGAFCKHCVAVALTANQPRPRGTIGQAERAGQYWCELLRQHRTPEVELAARQRVFDRWPTAANAVSIAEVAGASWADLSERFTLDLM